MLTVNNSKNLSFIPINRFPIEPRIIIYLKNVVIHGMAISETLKKQWKVLIAILAIIVIVYIANSIWSYQVSVGWGTTSRLYITEINESGVPNGNIIHITEEDFKKFPKLAPVIRDKTQRISGVSNNGTLISYTVFLTDNESSQFSSLYFPPNPDNLNRFFEYNGKYYSYNTPTIS
jgi:hypothetical protein